MPTLAAVPAQRVTQQTTKRPAKHPVVVNEAPATVRLQIHPIQVYPDHHVLRITDQPSNVEYTIYTFHVNIFKKKQHFFAAPKLCYAMHSTFTFHLRNSLNLPFFNSSAQLISVPKQHETNLFLTF